MLQNIAAHIAFCYERAQQARENAEKATSAQRKGDYLAAESRWLALAQSCERQSSPSSNAGLHNGSSGVVSRMVRQSGVSFDDDVVAFINIAYHAVLKELRLNDLDDDATLMVARQLIDFAAHGERDPERLKVATLTSLLRT